MVFIDGSPARVAGGEQGLNGNVLSGSFGKALENVQTQFDLDGIRFDPSSGVLSRAGSKCRLEPKAADVLTLLCRERGWVISRERLLESCWQADSGSDESLTQVIAQIRRSFETLGVRGDMLETYAKRGYRLSPDSSKGGRKNQRAIRVPAWVPLAVVAAACALILVFAPHWPRHVIRHALGLGPPHLQNHAARNGASH